MKQNVTLYRANEILLETIEHLSDRENVTGETLSDEIRRAEVLIGLSEAIIASAKLVLKAALSVNNSIAEVEMPEMFKTPKTQAK